MTELEETTKQAVLHFPMADGFVKEIVRLFLDNSDLRVLIRQTIKEVAEEKHLITKKELAAIYGVNPRTINEWIKQGMIVRQYPVTEKLTMFCPKEVQEDIDTYNGTHRLPWYKANRQQRA